jgi:RimJ/RimL family protein N-acetyltransferase
MAHNRHGEDRDKTTMPMLQTERLDCEPITAEHAAALFDALQNPSLYTYIPQEAPVDVKALTTRFRRLADEPHSADGSELWLNWVIRVRDTGSYAGTLEASVMSDAAAYIAYFVFEAHQRKGYAKEGVAALLEHLFDTHSVDVAVAEIDTRNAASIALVNSLGFECVARTVDADYFKGASSDEYRFELRRSAATPVT